MFNFLLHKFSLLFPSLLICVSNSNAFEFECLGNEIIGADRALRADLQLLRGKGAIKVGGSLDRPIIDSKSACARCCLVFGYINRGAECKLCHLRVCRECRIDIPFSKNDWVCIICYKEM